MQKTWKILAKLKTKDSKNRQKAIIKILLKNRGLKTKEQQEDFFKPQNPLDISIRQTGISKVEIKKAIQRIKKAKKQKELVIIYGDFDADGVTATAILWETLFNLEINVMPFIPDRDAHGHGLKKEGIETLIKELSKPGLIITVDNGITAFRSAKFCKKQGIDLIVCDHHQKRRFKVQASRFKVKLPEAKAIVHSDKLAGAGVAWFFAREILASYQLPATSYQLLELAAIGTITDVFPLIGVNRSLVKFGLKALAKTKRIGIKALLAEAQIDRENINTYTIGFIIGPRLNAMGRLAHALDSLRLLCTKDKGRGTKLAFELGQTNRKRQDLTLSSFDHAVESAKLRVKSSKLLVISHESYEQGIVGLVAGKLVDKFYRPAIVVAQGEKYSKGSARSIKGFNIIEALRQFEEDFIGLGGHPAAAGFTIETGKLAEVQKKLEQLANEQISDELLSPVFKIDCQINFADIAQKLYKKIEKFKPFGVGNSKPKFLIKNAQVVEARQVGNEGKHLKLRLKAAASRQKEKTGNRKLETAAFDAIFFSAGHLFDQLDPQKPIDIVFNIDENEWNGRKNLQLIVKDLQNL